MHPSTIASKEAKFAGDLKLANGSQMTLQSVKDIGNGFYIRSIRPTEQNYYYKADTAKKSICLHFTVGYILSDIAALTKAGSHVSVSYVVDRSGNIYELFPDRYWSYHLGNGAIGGNTSLSKQSIGIEICNYGPLTEKDDSMLDAYGNRYCSSWETSYYERMDYRGKQAFATMTPVQISAVATLLLHLCEKHSIPTVFTGTDEVFATAGDALAFSGIFMHSNVRKDKFDWPMCTDMQTLIVSCVPPVQETEAPGEPDGPQPGEAPVDEPASPEPAPPEQTAGTPVLPDVPARAEKSSFSGKLRELLDAILGLFRKG